MYITTIGKITLVSALLAPPPGEYHQHCSLKTYMVFTEIQFDDDLGCF